MRGALGRGWREVDLEQIPDIHRHSLWIFRANGQYSWCRCTVGVSHTVGVGVSQDSVLSPLLFIFVLEALSQRFNQRRGVPWELLYADYLVKMAATLDECIARLRIWKTCMQSKGPRVMMKKITFLISGIGLDLLKDSGKYHCAVWRKSDGSNCIACSQCKLWVHKKCVCPRWMPFEHDWCRRHYAQCCVNFLLLWWHAQCGWGLW